MGLESGLPESQGFGDFVEGLFKKGEFSNKSAEPQSVPTETTCSFDREDLMKAFLLTSVPYGTSFTLRQEAEALHGIFPKWKQATIKEIQNRADKQVASDVEAIESLTLGDVANLAESTLNTYVKELVESQGNNDGVKTHKLEETIQHWSRISDVTKAASEIRDY